MSGCGSAALGVSWFKFFPRYLWLRLGRAGLCGEILRLAVLPFLLGEHMVRELA